MHYRPEIDGLRTLAVVPVILFHAGVPAFGGGFVGVDVFFVISGYLITSILDRDLARGRFSLLRFYERRARRILPVLLLVAALCLPVAWVVMLPTEFADFGGSALAAALFSSNGYFWIDTGYFATASELKPLLHTWSLAVEEQFYVVFPIFLWAVWTAPGRARVVATALLALASFALCLWAVTAWPSANFFLAPFRAWELLAGSLCAYALSGRRPRGRDGPAFVGLGLLMASVVLIDATTPFPSAWTLLPVAGTVLVILHAAPDTRVGRLLSLRPLVALGLLSYGAYLFHQPMLAFTRLAMLDAPPVWVMAAIGLGAFAPAWASWTWVETPFRAGGAALPSMWGVFAVSGAGLATLAAVGTVIWLSGGVPLRHSDIAAMELRARIVPDRASCAFEGRIDAGALEACLADLTPADLVLWGDSHGRALAHALRSGAEGQGRRLVTLTHEGCLPVPGTHRDTDGAASCTAFTATVRDALARYPGIPVVIAARWTFALDGTRFDNGEGGRESGPEVATLAPGTTLSDRIVTEVSALAATRPVTVVGPIPEAGWNVPARFGRLMRDGPAATLSTSRAVFDTRNAAAFAVMDDLARRGVRLVDAGPAFCGQRRCLNAADGVSLYADDDHLSGAGAARIVPLILSGTVRLAARQVPENAPTRY